LQQLGKLTSCTVSALSPRHGNVIEARPGARIPRDNPKNSLWIPALTTDVPQLPGRSAARVDDFWPPLDPGPDNASHQNTAETVPCSRPRPETESAASPMVAVIREPTSRRRQVPLPREAAPQPPSAAWLDETGRRIPRPPKS
jgi:hypothetical protein